MSAQGPKHATTATRSTGPRLAALLQRETDLYTQSAALVRPRHGVKSPDALVRDPDYQLVQRQIEETAREIDYLVKTYGWKSAP